jgi:hypothetical protein
MMIMMMMNYYYHHHHHYWSWYSSVSIVTRLLDGRFPSELLIQWVVEFFHGR